MAKAKAKAKIKEAFSSNECVLFDNNNVAITLQQSFWEEERAIDDRCIVHNFDVSMFEFKAKVFRSICHKSVGGKLAGHCI